jgi:hypothetical protein
MGRTVAIVASALAMLGCGLVDSGTSSAKSPPRVPETASATFPRAGVLGSGWYLEIPPRVKALRFPSNRTNECLSGFQPFVKPTVEAAWYRQWVSGASLEIAVLHASNAQSTAKMRVFLNSCSWSMGDHVYHRAPHLRIRGAQIGGWTVLGKDPAGMVLDVAVVYVTQMGRTVDVVSYGGPGSVSDISALISRAVIGNSAPHVPGATVTE